MQASEQTRFRITCFVASIAFASILSQEIIAWYDAHPEQQVVDPAIDRLFDRMVDNMKKTLPN